MSKKKCKKTKAKTGSTMAIHLHKRIREGVLIATSAVAVFILLALMSYHQSDPNFSHETVNHGIANLGGPAGAWIADILLYGFGYVAYLFPFMLAWSGWLLFRADKDSESSDWLELLLRAAGFVFIIGAGSAIFSLQLNQWQGDLPYTSGGLVGFLIANGFDSVFNIIGSTLILLAMFLSGITLFTGFSWITLIDAAGAISLAGWESLTSGLSHGREKFYLYLDKRRAKKELAKANKPKPNPLKIEIKKPEPTVKFNKPKIQSTKTSIKTSERAQRDRQVPLFDGPVTGTLPSLSLLDPPERSTAKGYSHEQLEQMSREVEKRLKDFGIEVHVVAVHPGPVITRFEMQLAPGVKVSRISTLSKDLARSLSMVSVRIVEVIPGKSVVGLELPNENREMVRLSEVLSSQQYESAKSPSALALGKDIAGNPVIVDLAKMPHLLVAGTTGSGKSVGVNAMILSMLYKATPEQVRLILVDPKMLELSIYEGIPHLLTPVVTDMKQAANSLRWCVAEMERRYRLMAAMGVRNLAGFNNKVKEANKKDEPIPDPLWQGEAEETCPNLETLPVIVVVIDEFADMMMVVGKKVEQLIAIIAQKARAAGIHLILATQRPSVDVITGLIKANIPTRIAFQVSSKIDSRTVIDQPGADQLLGHGDMLYLPPGTSVPVRVHGAFVSDDEVHRVVNDWRKRGQPEYIESITAGGEEGEAGAGGGFLDQDGDKDELYDQAVFIVTKTRKASISGIQRRLKIGYNRAARLVEEMETAGVVTPMESNGSREVLAPPPPE